MGSWRYEKTYIIEDEELEEEGIDPLDDAEVEEHLEMWITDGSVFEAFNNLIRTD